MDPRIYISSFLASVAIVLLLCARGRSLYQLLAGFVGTACLGIAAGVIADLGNSQGIFSTIFSIAAVASSMRMVTHPRPIYCALYFVLVVLSSCGLLIMLDAQFIAFSLVIVYAGAILITYMFVLMLAQQADSPSDVAAMAEYDRIPKEPFAAGFVGFIVLSVLLNIALRAPMEIPPSASFEERLSARVDLINKLPKQREKIIADSSPSPESFVFTDREIFIDGKSVYILIDENTDQEQKFPIETSLLPGNIQSVGWYLVARFPVSLELAGIILLMAMFGAVVLARRQVELAEKEKLEALVSQGRVSSPGASQ